MAASWSLVQKYLLVSQVSTAQLLRSDLQQLHAAFHRVGFQQLQRKMDRFRISETVSEDLWFCGCANCAETFLIHLLDNLFGHSGVFQTVHLNRDQENSAIN